MVHAAFKESNAIVEALGAGAQILILRKGGIHEGRGGFKVQANRFWLFPTQFHAQQEKTKPSAAKFFTQKAGSEICLKFFAQVDHTEFLTDWQRISALDTEHLWTETAVRDRFEWSKPPGVHALVVRIHRVHTPISFEPTPEMAGCKSWVDLPFDFDAMPSEPVLSDALFSAAKARLSFVS